MKKAFLIILSVFSLVSFSCTKKTVAESNFSKSDTLRIATYNVRIRTQSDKENTNWEIRKPEVAALINSECFDIFGVQELIDLSQEKDLSKLLPDYECVSSGRDNQSGSEGERAAIYFQKDRFELLQKDFFFLSETPETVSKGWDAALNRICMWVKLNDRITGKSFYFFNTHFDHMGVKARSESAKLVSKKVDEIVGTETVFCVGDFNASLHEKDFYKAITQNLTDSRIVSEKAPEGSLGTFNGWDKNTKDFPASVLIDYIFTRKVKTISYKVINHRFGNNELPSDHFPVMIECVPE